MSRNKLAGIIVACAIIIALMVVVVIPRLTPSPQPAQFTVSNLHIAPREAGPGEPVTVSVNVQNVGQQEGTYVLELIVDGLVEQSKILTLDGAEQSTILFTVQKGTTGLYSIEVGDLFGSIEVVAAAEFRVSNLDVNPRETRPGGAVTVSVDVQNVGEQQGTYVLKLEVDGIAEQTKDITLTGGESTTVSFTVTKQVERTYNIEIDASAASFDVKIDWKTIGRQYQAADGLTVTLDRFDIVKKPGSYQYQITYTLANNTDRAIDEGQFKLYYKDELGGFPQYGFFDRLFPDDELTRSHTFEEEDHIAFAVLAYHHDQFGAPSPPADALLWRVEY